MRRECMWGLIALSFTICGCSAMEQDDRASGESTIPYESTVSEEGTMQEHTTSAEASTEESTFLSEETASSQEMVSTSSETSDEETMAETNCDGYPVWSFNDESLDESWNSMLSGYTFVFENWTRDGAELRESMSYKHCEYPVVTAWDVELFLAPSLEAETIRVPRHTVLYAEATDGNEWIYFADSDGAYSGWLHLIKEPNVMYRVKTVQGLLQLDQLFNGYETECAGTHQGVLKDGNAILPANSEEEFKIFVFKSAEELSAFIQEHEGELNGEAFLAELREYCTAWENDELEIKTAQTILLLYTSEYEKTSGTKTTTLWKDPDQTQDVIRLRIFYKKPIKTKRSVFYEFWEAGSEPMEFNNLTFQLIEYDQDGLLD